ncbi:TPA: hypothetical protein QFG09_000728 [Enterococcus faecium]
MNDFKKQKLGYLILSLVTFVAYLYFGYAWNAYTDLLFILAISIGTLFIGTRSDAFYVKWEKWSAGVDKEADKLAAQRQYKKENKNIIKCPTCRSTHVQFMQNNKKGFSVGKAVGGAALTGGIGALAGFAGKKGKNQWFCSNCNNTFETKS